MIVPFVLCSSCVTGLLLFYNSFKQWQKKRIIENIPTSIIKSAAMGLVEIYGVVKCNNTINSPNSGKECVYYEYALSDDDIRLADQENIGKCEFFLEDESGQVLVVPDNAKMKLSPGCIHEYEHKTNIIINDQQSPYYSCHIHKEYLIIPGDKVYVMGTLTNKNTYFSNYQQEPINKTKTSLIVHQGKGKPEGEDIFIISDESEKILLESLSVQIVYRLIIGVLLIIASLILLVIYYGRYQEIGFITILLFFCSAVPLIALAVKYK